MSNLRRVVNKLVSDYETGQLVFESVPIEPMLGSMSNIPWPENSRGSHKCGMRNGELFCLGGSRIVNHSRLIHA